MNDVPRINGERAYFEITVCDVMHGEFARQFTDQYREQRRGEISADPGVQALGGTCRSPDMDFHRRVKQWTEKTQTLKMIQM
jgi:hypothetical protein